jgi:putative DNA primase/helicase
VAGLEVRGYRPSEFEHGRLIRTLSRQTVGEPGDYPLAEATSSERASDPRRVASPADRDERRATRRDTRSSLLTGELIEHGRAPYHHDPHERMSYFVKIETARGDRTIWGIDLERAVRESLTQPQVGNTIGLRAVRQDAVKVKAAERDPNGQVIRERDLETHRNRWIVEKHSFFEARAAAAQTLSDPTLDPKQAVRQYPELVGTYLQIRAAEIAARRFRDPEDQQKFVARVRSSLAASVARGEPLPPVRLQEAACPRVRSGARMTSWRVSDE